MNAVIEITIGGEKRTLRFNNYAHVELSKALFEKGHIVSSPKELIDRLTDMATENVALLMKALVYAGIIGDDYETKGFAKSVTVQQVGEMIANVDEKDLLAVWDVFLEAMGLKLSDLLVRRHEEEEAPEESEDEKKISDTLNSTLKPSVN